MIEIKKKNETYLQIQCEEGVAQELNDKFSFFATGYKFMPQFKKGLWDRED